jgi:hypothetical protein
MSGPVGGLGGRALPPTVSDNSQTLRNGNTTRRPPWSVERANVLWEEVVLMIMKQKGVSREVAEAEANIY